VEDGSSNASRYKHIPTCADALSRDVLSRIYAQCVENVAIIHSRSSQHPWSMCLDSDGDTDHVAEFVAAVAMDVASGLLSNDEVGVSSPAPRSDWASSHVPPSSTGPCVAVMCATASQDDLAVKDDEEDWKHKQEPIQATGRRGKEDEVEEVEEEELERDQEETGKAHDQMIEVTAHRLVGDHDHKSSWEDQGMSAVGETHQEPIPSAKRTAWVRLRGSLED